MHIHIQDFDIQDDPDFICCADCTEMVRSHKQSKGLDRISHFLKGGDPILGTIEEDDTDHVIGFTPITDKDDEDVELKDFILGDEELHSRSKTIHKKMYFVDGTNIVEEIIPCCEVLDSYSKRVDVIYHRETESKIVHVGSADSFFCFDIDRRYFSSQEVCDLIVEFEKKFRYLSGGVDTFFVTLDLEQFKAASKFLIHIKEDLENKRQDYSLKGSFEEEVYDYLGGEVILYQDPQNNTFCPVVKFLDLGFECHFRGMTLSFVTPLD